MVKELKKAPKNIAWKVVLKDGTVRFISEEDDSIYFLRDMYNSGYLTEVMTITPVEMIDGEYLEVR